MRKIKISIMILAVLISVFLSGCGNRGEVGTLTQEDIYKGHDGLEMEFLKDSPPSETYQEQNFPVLVTLTNKGAYDIEDGILVFVVEDDYIALEEEDWNLDDSMELVSSTNVRYDLKGKTLSYPDGDTLTFSLQPRTLALEKQSAIHTVDIVMVSCFEYETKLSADVCIDFDIYETETSMKTCEVKDQTFGGGQGAPIGITSIKQEIFPGEEGQITPTFLIEVKNYDTGYPYASSNTELMCSSTGEDIKKKFNEVEITASLAGTELECSPGNIMKLKDGKDYVRCKTSKPLTKDQNGESYTTSLLVKLKYGYTKSISKSMLIKRFPE